MRFEELSRARFPSRARRGTLAHPGGGQGRQGVGGGLIAFNLDAHPLISLNDNRRATLNPAESSDAYEITTPRLGGGQETGQGMEVGLVPKARNEGGSEIPEAIH